MRIWDEQDGCWLECEAISIGSHPVTSSDGWVYRQSYLSRASSELGDEPEGNYGGRCACGTRIALSRWSIGIKKCGQCAPHSRRSKHRERKKAA